MSLWLGFVHRYKADRGVACDVRHCMGEGLLGAQASIGAGLERMSHVTSALGQISQNSPFGPLTYPDAIATVTLEQRPQLQ
jgi:hypothetical protein